MSAPSPISGTESAQAVEARFEAFRGRSILVLERIAAGAPLADTFAQVISLIEEQSPGSLASILLLEEDGRHLRHGAAPSLPESYCQAVNHLPIGPGNGSCGTAAWRGQRVVVSNISTDPLWESYRQLAEPLGLRACWSEPILDSRGKVAGTFAIYHTYPCEPTSTDIQVIRAAAHLLGIALERDRREEERLAAERQRAAIERKLIETQKLESLGVLAGGIAHDFNNLLTGILGYTGLIRRELPEVSPILPFVEGVEHTALRAGDLCKQMLAYAGRGRFVIQRLNLSTLVHETERLLLLSIGKKASLCLELADHLPPIEADATQLRQILMNLVINASEAIGDHPGRITLSTSHLNVDRAYLGTTLLAHDLPAGDYVTLEVTDTGCGMDAETVARIFDPFFTTKFTGRGLGLAAVHGIVRAHRGSLKVYSEPGRGTTFKLLLPAVEAGEPLPPAPAPPPCRGTGRVLLVDDEESVRSVTGLLLRSMGFDVITACDGQEAVERFREHAASLRLVLLDLTMPRLSGEEAYREMRLIDPKVRVLLMSGFTEQEATAHFAGRRLAGFLQKPFTIATLQARLAEVLGPDPAT